MAFDGYITDVNELYVFMRSINRFGDEFQKGCLSIANATELDYSLAHREVQRLKQRVFDFEAELSRCESEYREYMQEEKQDCATVNTLIENINNAQINLNRAKRDLSEGESIFIQIINRLKVIKDLSNSYAYQLNDLCSNATMTIKRSADIIETNYMS